VISRLASLSDTSGTLESYDYLGLSTVIRRAHSQPGVDLTYIKQTGEANGDAGDQYTGLDRFGRVVDQRWIVTSNGTHTDRFQYGYDRDSNALYRNNLVNTAFGELYHASGAGNGYDNLNQLSGFLRGVLTASGGPGTPLDTVASPSHTQTFTPDAVGNFSSVTTDGTAVTRTHNQQNEVTGVGANTLVFDKNGNMTTDEQGRTLIFDAWNRLVAVKSGSTTLASYKFDGLGRRIVETASSNTRDLLFDNWSILEERLNGASTADVQYVWSPLYVNALILRDRSTLHNGTLDERLWVQQDANWNVTALINNSSTVVERYVYDPFGLITFLNANWGTLASSGYNFVYLFQGEQLDPVTGLYHADARDYSASLSRWVNPDPKGYAARDNNLYRFVGNNPTNNLDPTGMEEITPEIRKGVNAGFKEMERIDNLPDPEREKALEAMYQKMRRQQSEYRPDLNGPQIGPAPGTPEYFAYQQEMKWKYQVSMSNAGYSWFYIYMEAFWMPHTGFWETTAVPLLAPFSVRPRADDRDSIYEPTSKGTPPSDRTIGRRFWKDQAENPSRSDYTPQDFERMRNGDPPQRYNPAKGGIESMERSHEPIPKRDGGTAMVPRWPQEHAKVDPNRKPGY